MSDNIKTLRTQLQAMHRRAQKAEGQLQRIYSEHVFAKHYGLSVYASLMINNKVWNRIDPDYAKLTPEQAVAKWFLDGIVKRLQQWKV